MHASDEIEREESVLEEAQECDEHRSQDFDEELTARLEAAFSQSTTDCNHELAKIVEEYSPIDLALACLRFNQQHRVELLDQLQKLDDRIEFLINLDSPTRTYIFRGLDDSELVELIQAMPADEAVWVMEDLVVPRYRRVIEALDPKKAAAINELAKFDPDSAGRLMTNEFFAFSHDTTIGQAAAYIRDNPSIDLLRRIFVHDESGELQGFVPLRNLVVNPPNLPLKRVMRPIAHWVHPDARRDEVIEIFERYKNSDLPVVDKSGRLIGVVTYEDVAEAIENQTDETLSAIAGTTQHSSVEDPLWKSFFARAPWLVVTLFAGFVNATNISMFNVAPEVMMFLPLVIGMSGNIGIQCSTLMIRAMTLGLIGGSRSRKLVAKEISTALVTGIAFSAISGFFIFTLTQAGWLSPDTEKLHLAGIVALGQIGACLIASVIGVFSPLIFHRMGIDPAVASGPITTAVNDVMSSIMYFVIAAVLSLFLTA
jgi:magnesium transporter